MGSRLPLAGPASSPPYLLFVGTWAVYALVHHLATAPLWLRPSPLVLTSALSFVLALAVLDRPSSIGRFAALLVVWAAGKAASLPTVPNHVLFTLAADLALVAALGWAALRRGRESRQETTIRAVAPALRLGLLVLYGWAFLHKLNRDYFDPEVSCGAVLYRQIANGHALLPQDTWASEAALVGGLLLEVAIPLSLLWRPTRRFGVLLALAFHLFLSLHPAWLLDSFGSMLAALLLLFAPPEFAARATASIRRVVRRIGAGALRGSLLAAALGFVAAVATALVVDPATQGAIGSGLALVGRRLWFLWAGVVLVACVFLWRGEARSPRDAFVPRPVLFSFLPVLLVANGLAPYLGLKTETSFSMFANLRTEGGRSNHLLFSPRLQLFGLQRELATVVESTVPGLPAGRRYPWFEVRRRLVRAGDEGGTAVIQRGDQETGLVFPRDLDHPDLVAHPLLDRLLVFRPVAPAGEPVPCGH